MPKNSKQRRDVQLFWHMFTNHYMFSQTKHTLVAVKTSFLSLNILNQAEIDVMKNKLLLTAAHF